jgi:tetratricopeptide (TPR) repeat protein
MTRDNEYYINGITEISEALATGIQDHDEMRRATRNLIHFHIRLEQYEEAKDLLRQYFNFNRKDLLHDIALLSRFTNDTTFAEELIGDIRCYAYTWMEFCVDMQQLYMNLGQVEKAEELQRSVVEVAFMSMRPATKALMRSLEISGHISDSYILKNLHKEVKRIRKERI